ncbi:MAG TPA: DUF4386 domain-containing protein [Bryobacteraceae bacterium]|nr:DUF4386 domain-containing protein [Bryobacteraceae bacterium]
MMERSQLYAARIFGITYLLSLAIITVAFSRFYAPHLVWENGEQTARHFIDHEPAVRLYLAGAFLHGLGMMVLLTTLYVILRPVNRGIALCAAFSKLTYAVFWFILVLDLMAALRLLGGAGSLRTLGADGLAALAGSQLDSSRDAYYIGLVFNGLGSALFAWVFFQSRYVPRALALWGVLGSLYSGFCGFAYLIYPGFGSILSANWYEFPPMTYELLLCIWLLFLGFRSSRTASAGPQR